MSTNTTTNALDLDAIEARANAATRGPWTNGRDGLAEHEVHLSAFLPVLELSAGLQGEANAAFIAHARTDVPALVAEVRRLREQLDKPCGSCHPCTNYAYETWRAAGRTPPHVITWDDAQAELMALRPVVAAAQAWAKASVTGIEHRPHEEALYAAVKGLPNPAKHEDI